MKCWNHSDKLSIICINSVEQQGWISYYENYGTSVWFRLPEQTAKDWAILMLEYWLYWNVI